MKRASRSVPHNIGEGVGKRGKARAASYEIALGEAKELIVALDCVEIDPLAPTAEIVAWTRRSTMQVWATARAPVVYGHGQAYGPEYEDTP